MIQWEFTRTAKAFVASQAQKTNNGNNSIPLPPSRSNSNNESSSLIELNHWVVEQRQCGDGAFANHIVKNMSQDYVDDDVVYLLHPPVLISCTTNANDEKIMNPTSSSLPSSLMDVPDDEEMEEAIDIEEYNIETIEEEASIIATTNYSEQIAIALSTSYCEQYYTEWTFSIVFHETWRVPTLYFTCGHSDGIPLCRRQVLDILLRHTAATTSCQQQKGGDWNEEELWDFVSQEEHPMTGKPSYFLHPCRTAERMEVMLQLQSRGVDGSDGKNENNGGCPLLSWMSMVLPVVGCSSLSARDYTSFSSRGG